MKKVLMPVAALTPVLVAVLLMVLFAPATAFSQNNPPPAGGSLTPPSVQILDLSGQPLPGGGNGETYVQYTADFTATQTNATITFAFRDDVADISFANVSVVDVTADSAVPLANNDFSQGVVGSTPTSWTWANISATGYEGVVQTGSSYCYTELYCWYDGSSQGYDTISQAITTVVGHNYQISFFVAENSFCSTNGNGLTCNFSDISSASSPKISGTDVVVYVAGGTPLGTQTLTLALLDGGTGTVTDNLGANGIGTCYEAAGIVYQNGVVQTSGTCTATVQAGTQVTLTAAPDVPSPTTPSTTFGAPASGQVLAIPGWGGVCSPTKTNPLECNLTMNSAESATAAFVVQGQAAAETLTTGTPTTFPFNGGYNGTGGFDFAGQLAQGSSSTTGVVNAVPIDPGTCNTIIGSAFPGAYCFVYQVGSTPAEPPDSAQMFELTCPALPGGTCGSVQTANFFATLSSDFTFDVTSENPGLTTPVVGGNEILEYDTGNPYVGVVKFEGPDPYHPCYLPSGQKAPSPSNQVISFNFVDPGAKPATGGSAGTGSCWIITYNMLDEVPTASIAPGNSGQVYTQGSSQTATFTCTAVNNSLVPVGGPATGAVGPYLTVNTCTLYDAYGLGNPASYLGTTTPANTASGTNSTQNTVNIDTGTLGTHTLTATVVDSATNTASSSTVTYYVGSTTVTVGTSPAGLQFTVDGISYNSAQQFTWGIGTQHTFTTTAAQSSTGTQYAFTGWSDGTSTASDTVVASSSTTSYTANFSTSYQLTTVASPSGDGSVTPSSGTYYPSGTVVPLQATANLGYNFSSWSGPVANSGTASTTVTMNAPASVTANFVVNNTSVTINTSPTGLQVSVDGGAAKAAPVNVVWQVGTNHTIATTSPQGSSGTQYTFTSWTGGAGTTNLSYGVTASSSTPSYTANFSTSYQLTTAASPSADGTVTPASGSYYAAGTVVNLTATANSGYVFSSWTGPVASSSSASTTVTMSGPESVTANFTTPPALTISPASWNIASPMYPGQSATQTFTVKNPGTTSITISSITVPGNKIENPQPPGDPDDFQITSNKCGSTLAGGASCTVTVTFVADSDDTPLPNPGNYANLTIADNASGSPQTAYMSVRVINPKVSLSSTSLSFGKQTTGQTSAAMKVTLTNSGTGVTPLTFGTISIRGNVFALASGTTCVNGGTVVAGANCVIYVTITPAVKGTTYSGSVTITDNAQNSPQSISLSGTGK